LTYKNKPKGHSFSGANVTHDSRGKGSFDRFSVRDSVPCWGCGQYGTARVTVDRGLICHRCGVSLEKRHPAGQKTLK